MYAKPKKLGARSDLIPEPEYVGNVWTNQNKGFSYNFLFVCFKIQDDKLCLNVLLGVDWTDSSKEDGAA